MLAKLTLALLKIGLQPINLERTRCQVCWLLTWDGLGSLQASDLLLQCSH